MSKYINALNDVSTAFISPQNLQVVWCVLVFPFLTKTKHTEINIHIRCEACVLQAQKPSKGTYFILYWVCLSQSYCTAHCYKSEVCFNNNVLTQLTTKFYSSFLL